MNLKFIIGVFMFRKMFFLLLVLVIMLVGCSDDIGIEDNGNPVIPSYDAGFEALFSLDTVKTVHIHITEAEWNGLLNDFDNNNRNEVCRKATFYYGDTNSANMVENVGFRIRGNSFSRKRPEVDGYSDGVHHADNLLARAHFKVKFNEKFDGDESVYGAPSQDVATISNNAARTFSTVRQLNFKYNKGDSSYLKEVFSYDLFRRFGVQAPRACFSKIYIKIGDDVEKYVGVFTMFEQVDKQWSKIRYGETFPIFKCLYQTAIADLGTQDSSAGADAGLIGMEITDPSDSGWTGTAYRPSYDLKTKDTEFLTAETKLNDLIALLNSSPTKSQLEDAIDIQALLRAQAVSVYLGMWDDYWRNGNNYYLIYRSTDQKWMFIPYDYDSVLGGTTYVGSDAASSSFTNWGASNPSAAILMNDVLAIPEFMTDYKNYIAQLYSDANEYMKWSAVESKMQGFQSLISSAVTGYDSIDSYPYSSDLSGFELFVTIRESIARLENGDATATANVDLDGNVSFATAQDLLLNSSISSVIDKSVDKDYYKINVISGGWYTFSLTGISADLELRLYDSSENFLADSLHGGSTPEVITANLTNNGDYYLFIEGWSGAISSYSLLAVATNRPEIVLDGSTNGDSYGAAILVNTANTNVKRVWAKRVGSDWYFAIEGTVATGSLLPDNGGIDIMVAIDDLDNVSGVTNLDSWWGLPVLSFNSGESAEYYINLQARDPKVSPDSSSAVKPNNFYYSDQAHQGDYGYGLPLSYDSVYEMKIAGLGSTMTNIKIATFVWSAAGAWSETPPNMDGPIVESIPARVGSSILPTFVAVP